MNAVTTRRTMMQRTAAVLGGLSLRSAVAGLRQPVPHKLKFGLVTYLWGQHMDLPTVISSCEQSGLAGVELRTQHKHGVEPTLSATERAAVKKRFADSSVELVGYGSNCEFHSADPAQVQANIDQAKQYIQLMHDCGGSGLKVKPNGFAADVPREKTIEQIGRALNEVAAYGQKYGQAIRVEVHGRGTSELPVMRDIFQVADHPNVGVCWNSNDVDLAGEGLQPNFDMVRDRFADTVHVRELNVGSYPYRDLFRLMIASEYAGWILLEARTNPDDKIAAMKEQARVFEELCASAA